jgi:3-deoxy-D-manno-octulosonic-acid transferase
MNWLDPLYLAAGGLTAPWWARKQRHDWDERFGKIQPVPPRDGLKRVLIHAVSVGEVNALRELIPLLTPRLHTIISVGTDTGIKRARELFAGTCDIVRYPLDLSWSVRRFLDRVRPDAVALVELELWPNFIAACKKRHIPVGVINGRLSERSFSGYRRLRPLLRRTFASLDFAAVQDDAYAARFRAMGIPPDRCTVTGSMKWDAARIEDAVHGADSLACDLGIARGPGAPPLIVAGSTGPGEEELLRRACDEVESTLGPIQLLCAPRKPERFDEAAAALGPDCIRRSRAEPPRPTRRFLLDTIGELRKAYALADLVVVGRSFGDLFGSDPIEPIALGRATLIGPAVKDFRTIVDLFDRAGGIIRTTRDTLPRDLASLLANPERRVSLADAGRTCIRSMQGASARHAAMIFRALGLDTTSAAASSANVELSIKNPVVQARTPV